MRDEAFEGTKIAINLCQSRLDLMIPRFVFRFCCNIWQSLVGLAVYLVPLLVAVPFFLTKSNRVKTAILLRGQWTTQIGLPPTVSAIFWPCLHHHIKCPWMGALHQSQSGRWDVSNGLDQLSGSIVSHGANGRNMSGANATYPLLQTLP